MAKCKSCGARIQWWKTENGKNMPVDDPCPYWSPDLQGNLVVKINNQPAMVVSVPKDSHLHVQATVSHFATCPNADHHRK
jgi:hypothetical protein